MRHTSLMAPSGIIVQLVFRVTLNKMHKTAEKKCGVNKEQNNPKENQDQQSNIASYDATYNGLLDFQMG